MYGLLTKATQQHIFPENNTYEAFRPALTSDSLLTTRVTVSVFPSDPAHLQKTIADAVHVATGIPHPPTLGPYHQAHHVLAIQVPPTDASSLIK